MNFHPHVHAIVSRGGWTRSGTWVAVPWVDPHAAELLFRHEVLSLLRNAGLIDEERISLLFSWKHTGFSVHNSVTVAPEDAAGAERLVRYLMRAPVSQQRLEIDEETTEVRVRAKSGADDAATAEESETLDPDEAVARIWRRSPSHGNT
ncbi:MAG TPA: transposase [Thermoanaerobaculia bacterium]|nr:transposase [Thermoanaerobaculia bacterium]